VDLLSQQGYAVAVADVNDTSGSAVASRAGGRYLHLDVGRAESWGQVGEVDVAVLCAGVMTGVFPAPVSEWAPSRWERLRAVNIDGVLNGVRAVGASMMARGQGSIVIMSSMSGLAPLPNDPLYSASKHFGIGLIRSVAPELGARGVRINAMCPSSTATPLIPSAAAARGTAMLTAGEVASATVELLQSGETGAAWTIAAGHGVHRFEYADIPLSVRPGARAGVQPG
jgi:NAD(P)-dependent dehydrogenase (short-subunit alcohol dehydrogenase family)